MTAHVSNNSGNNEWYTPVDIIDKARLVMGSIDTDPASNSIAQQTVLAKEYYTLETNGLDKKWYGNVWMNPPYSASLIKQFCAKLKTEVLIGNTKAFVTLTNNATETKWFKDLSDVSKAFCFLTKRVRFVSPDGLLGKQPLQGQVMCMHGSDDQVKLFSDVFKDSGIILFP